MNSSKEFHDWKWQKRPRSSNQDRADFFRARDRSFTKPLYGFAADVRNRGRMESRPAENNTFSRGWLQNRKLLWRAKPLNESAQRPSVSKQLTAFRESFMVPCTEQNRDGHDVSMANAIVAFLRFLPVFHTMQFVAVHCEKFDERRESNWSVQMIFVLETIAWLSMSRVCVCVCDFHGRITFRCNCQCCVVNNNVVTLNELLIVL